MILSKLTSKGQVTVPKTVRQRLQLELEPGDTIVYELEEESVRIRKVKGFDIAWHQAGSSTLEEWATPEDDEVFGGL